MFSLPALDAVPVRFTSLEQVVVLFVIATSKNSLATTTLIWSVTDVTPSDTVTV